MPKHKTKPIPPCPYSEPSRLVRQKNGRIYWRRVRGTFKPATLNLVLERNTKNIKAASPAAKRMAQRLEPFLAGIKKGRLIARLTSLLVKALNEYRELNYSFFDGFELQKDYPLGKMLLDPFTVKLTGDTLEIRIPLQYQNVARRNVLVTEYYFDLVLLYGDPSIENGLRVESTTSSLYSFNDNRKMECLLALEVPANKPWMAMLKVSCLEGVELAAHCKHYGMRVVKVSKMQDA